MIGQETWDFFYYMWNRWNEKEAHLIFPDWLADHFWTKWCDYCYMYGPDHAITNFVAGMEKENLSKIVARAKEYYAD